jgi:16S rRNA processing protein RimM
LPVTLLPKLPEDEFYWHELVGCELFNEDALVGTVKGIVDIPGNELVEVDAAGRELLIPMSNNFLQKFSRAEKKIFMQLPEGLLEL